MRYEMWALDTFILGYIWSIFSLSLVIWSIFSRSRASWGLILPCIKRKESLLIKAYDAKWDVSIGYIYTCIHLKHILDKPGYLKHIFGKLSHTRSYIIRIKRKESLIIEAYNAIWDMSIGYIHTWIHLKHIFDKPGYLKDILVKSSLMRYYITCIKRK